MYIKIPIQDEATEKLFRYGYARDVLLFLAKNPNKAFTVSELIDILEIRSRDALTKLLDSMKEANLIQSNRVGRKRFVEINTSLIEKPEDPLFQIPQEEYRGVVKKIIDQINKIKQVKNVILFGAIARGTADRMSDIDILVVGEDVTRLQEKTSKIAYDCRTGKILKQRFEVNIRVITPAELEEPRGFIRDALSEGIMLYGDRNGWRRKNIKNNN
ncbi:MAG: nucleotidyltransferase domain-containing protein [Methanomassiliicoccales archaeon]|nr:MAG: nucleotidyltransferase domain-containing protein [Methanomassiliicoccales archaeon]